MEHKTFPVLDVKIINEDQGIVEHTVAVMGNVDLGDDRIWNGAFLKTISERGKKVKVLDNHKADSVMRVIGKPLSLREIGRDELPQSVKSEYPDATGALLVQTQFLMDVPEGKGAFIRIKEKAIDEWSIGYDSIKGATEYTKENGRTVRELKEIRLFEYSPVLWAMNPAASTISAKSKKQTYHDYTYNGIKCQATRRRSSSRDDKKYERDVKFDDKEKIVHYGDPDMEMQRDNEEARDNFLSRHKCDTKSDPFAPGYWACYDWSNVGEKEFDVDIDTKDDNVDDKTDAGTTDEPESKAIRSTARSPKYEDTETTSWADVGKTMADFIAGYYKNTGAEKPEEAVTSVGAMPSAMKTWIANKSLLGNTDTEDFNELVFFPVVNPGTNKLNEGALRAVISGRGSQANIAEAAKTSAQNKARSLLKDEFGMGEDEGNGLDSEQDGKDAKAINLSQQVEDIRQAFQALYNTPNSWDYWVNTVYDEYIIITHDSIDGTQWYQVPYTQNGDNYEFAPRADWIEGEYEFTAGSGKNALTIINDITTINEPESKSYDEERYLGTTLQALVYAVVTNITARWLKCNVISLPELQVVNNTLLATINSMALPEDLAMRPVERYYEYEYMSLVTDIEQKAGRTLSAANVAKLQEAITILEALAKIAMPADMPDEEEGDEGKNAPEKAASKQQQTKAGSPQAPTSRDDLLKQIQIQQIELEAMEV